MSGGLVVVLVLVVSSIAAEYHKRVYILKATLLLFSNGS